MSLRDETELVLRAWDRYEKSRNSPPVIDFDCHPHEREVDPATSRLAIAYQFEALRQRAQQAGDSRLAVRIGAHLAYVCALLGKRIPLEDYVVQTQGCRALGWPEEYVRARGDLARRHLSDLGVRWGPQTNTELDEAEGVVDIDAACEIMRQAVADLDPKVRRLAGTSAPYELNVTTVTEDAYWAYWLDGTGHDIRLRLNLRNAGFTEVGARQFGLHEVLGHGLQSVSYAQQCASREVEWVRLLSVHAPQQVLLEGLAQALPLFVAADDAALVARVRLVHYTQLVRAELHLAVNSGTPVTECARRAQERVPFWSEETISDLLADRGTNPLLRSYLWSYPAGVDWFVSLADDADTATTEHVLRAAYRDPLTPDDLSALWPAGPAIGGPGQ